MMNEEEMASRGSFDCPRCPKCGQNLKVIDEDRGVCMKGHGVFPLRKSS